MKKTKKRRIDSPLWCILHAVYLLRYAIIAVLVPSIFWLWMLLNW